MNPGERDAAAGGGYAPALLARHVLLSLTHMRRVVREMRDAGSGCGMFAAIVTLVGTIILSGALSVGALAFGQSLGWLFGLVLGA